MQQVFTQTKKVFAHFQTNQQIRPRLDRPTNNLVFCQYFVLIKIWKYDAIISFETGYVEFAHTRIHIRNEKLSKNLNRK